MMILHKAAIVAALAFSSVGGDAKTSSDSVSDFGKSRANNGLLQQTEPLLEKSPLQRSLATNSAQTRSLSEEGAPIPWSSYFNDTLEEGDNVTLTNNLTVILDVSPPILFKVILMNGATLIIPRYQDILLEAHHIHVMHQGRLDGGTPEDPVRGRVTIRLKGQTGDAEQSPEAGAKAIFVHDGFMNFHGEPREPTWTKLAATAHIGNSSLLVRGNVDWQVGETIAVTPSSFDRQSFDEMQEAEQVAITRIVYENVTNTTEIGIAAILNWTHFGEVQCWPEGQNDHCIDTSAEVALLSRNFVIEGDMDDGISMDEGFGGHIKMHNDGGSGTWSRISYVECRFLGQRGNLGKYPIHFHVPGIAAGSYAIGNAIHHSFNRAITVHGAKEMYISKNVAFDVEGHAMYLEDGSETGNVFEGNIVFNQREGSITDEDRTPACYWISNANNTFLNNVAAGSLYAGFWFHPEKNSAGDPDACPRYTPLGQFSGNTAHSCFKYGVEVTRWLPKTSCDDNAPDVQATISGTTAWKNSYSGIRLVGTGGNGAILFDGLKLADNGMTYHTSSQIYYSSISPFAGNGTVGVRDGLFIHISENDPFSKIPVENNPVRRAFHLPDNSDNWFVEDCVFVNYYNEGWVLDPNKNTKPSKTDEYGFEIRTRKLTFINSPNRVHFRFPHHGIVVDLDGSLSETNFPNRIVAKSPLYDPNKCDDIGNVSTYPEENDDYEEVLHSVPLMTCAIDYPIRRLGEGEVLSVDASPKQEWVIYSGDGNTTAEITSFGSKGLFTIACPTNKVIDVYFPNEALPCEWHQQFGPASPSKGPGLSDSWLGRRYMSQDEYILLRFQLEHKTRTGGLSARFNLKYDDEIAVPLLSDKPTATDEEPGCFYDNSTDTLHVLFLNYTSLHVEFCSSSPNIPNSIFDDDTNLGLPSEFGDALVKGEYVSTVNHKPIQTTLGRRRRRHEARHAEGETVFDYGE